jgi:hypothetical protein
MPSQQQTADDANDTMVERIIWGDTSAPGQKSIKLNPCKGSILSQLSFPGSLFARSTGSGADRIFSNIASFTAVESARRCQKSGNRFLFITSLFSHDQGVCGLPEL